MPNFTEKKFAGGERRYEMFAGGNYGGFGKKLRGLSQRDCMYIPGRRKSANRSKPTNGGRPVINSDRCIAGRDIAKVRRSAPKRTRMLAEAETRYISYNERIRRAAITGAIFGIFGGAIALFVTGTEPTADWWSESGVLIAVMLAITGAVIGYFSKR